MPTFRYEPRPGGGLLAGVRATLARYGSSPLPQRLEGNDTQTWVEPTPSVNDYQTYFYGNQLPGTHTQIVAGTTGDRYVSWRDTIPTAPQLNGVTFGQQLGVGPSQALIARWRSLWTGTGGPGGGS